VYGDFSKERNKNIDKKQKQKKEKMAATSDGSEQFSS
jgi:hypothetical protein